MYTTFPMFLDYPSGWEDMLFVLLHTYCTVIVLLIYVGQVGTIIYGAIGKISSHFTGSQW